MRKGLQMLFVAAVLVAGAAECRASANPGREMLETIRTLAVSEFRGRGIGTPELDRAARLIAERFESLGLMPGGPQGSWYQEWVDPDLKIAMRNVVGVLPGRNPHLAVQSVVVGAHYDHLGMRPATPGEQPVIHPGADDNASGVAVMLEVASRLALALEPERSVVFVAFTGEEEGRKGSKHYVREEKLHPVSRCIGMVNLDTVGRLGRNKVIVLGMESAREWPDLFKEAGKVSSVETAAGAPGLDASDQASFQDAGVPAVQLFAGANRDYHRPTDTVDKIDVKGLIRVAALARAATLYLANLEGALTPTLPKQQVRAPEPRMERKVTIGIIPDFTYTERGVRLAGVAAGGPAEAAGLREGDIIIEAGHSPIADLRDLSEALKKVRAGDRMPARILRKDGEQQIELEVKEK
ncbi:MAG: M20/M25/M40 family metallo-hydrolase [Nitrospiraceae bacterium]|nr:M20/M25/M40 family metallo-hydrolase [Nitrospiraceae bacterium]